MINYFEKFPTPEEFNSLYIAVGWGSLEKNIIETALKSTIYSVCVYDNKKLIGYGRIIGDKAMFLYIQDIMVLPEYQNKNIGTNIMNKIINKINVLKQLNPNIRTYIGPSKGIENFYRKFGFITRKEADLGEGMILKR